MIILGRLQRARSYLTSLPSTVTRAMLEPSNRTLRAAVNLTPPPSSVRRTEELVPAPTSAALEGAASTSTVGYAEAGSTLSALRAAFFFADAGSAVFGAVGGSGCGGLGAKDEERSDELE